MSKQEPLLTTRLALRRLRDDDIEGFAALHADQRMMPFLAQPKAGAPRQFNGATG